MKYKLVIFDLDGTLMDTTEGILESVKDTVKAYGMSMPSEHELRSYIGPPIQLSFARTYGLDKDDAQRMADTFREIYSSANLLKATPYPGIFDTLSHLVQDGAKTAIATYKREDYALRLLCHYGFDRYAASMHGADNLNLLSKSDIIRLCIDQAGCSGSFDDVVMVGDTLHDAIGAADLGIDFVGVNYGFGFTGGMVYDIDAIGFADSPRDILDFVL